MKIEIIKGKDTPVVQFFSSSSTPETDAEAWIETDRANAVVFAKFARKLERERDEARFLLKAAQSALDAIHLEVGSWIKTMKENTD
jgi:hypothetical protein